MKLFYSLISLGLIVTTSCMSAMEESKLNVIIANQSDTPCFIFSSDRSGSEPIILNSADDSRPIALHIPHSRLYFSTTLGTREVRLLTPGLEVRAFDTSDPNGRVVFSTDEPQTDVVVAISPEGTISVTNRSDIVQNDKARAHATAQFQEALYTRGSSDNFQEAERWLHAGADINARDRSGNTPLTYYAKMFLHLSEHSIVFLLRRGAKVNIQDADGNTPLHYLVGQVGYYRNQGGRLIEKFLDAGADITIKNHAGISVQDFMNRVPENDKQILIDKGMGLRLGLLEKASRNDRNNRNHFNEEATLAFHTALSEKNYHEARRLLQAGANINGLDASGCTALTRYASMCPELSHETIKFLLDNDADVNAQDQSGRTALLLLIQQVAFYNRVGGDLIFELIALGANPRLAAKNGISAQSFLREGDRCGGVVPQSAKDILIAKGLGNELGIA